MDTLKVMQRELSNVKKEIRDVATKCFVKIYQAYISSLYKENIYEFRSELR